jgi:signal transduction histidine kinase
MTAPEERDPSDLFERARDHFLRAVSHELRTPVSVALVWANLLREKRVPAEQVDTALAAIEQSIRDQKRLVDLLGDAARASSGQIRLDRTEVDLAPIVRESLELIRPMADRRDITIEDAIAPCGSALLDVDRFHQAMSQLLGNAQRHTPVRGRIVVTTSVADSRAMITIRDTGSGVHPDLLPHLFEPLVLVHRAALRTAGEPPPGLGLGLLIARRIIEAHSGALRAASDGIGRGTTLTILLPQAAA